MTLAIGTTALDHETGRHAAPLEAMIEELGRHYALFLAGILEVDLWSMQLEICDAVMQPRADVAIKGCHACSKTFTLACIALAHVCMFPDGGVITTAPTWEQVRRVMWAEIRKAQKRSGIRFPVINQTEIKASENDSNTLIGISTNDSTRFQGWHGNMLIIVDEAPGVFGELHEAIEGIRAAGDVRKVQLGNPTMSVGPFYEAFTSQSARTTGYSISCMDTPNFAGVDLDDLLARSEDDPYLDDDAIPYLIGRRFVWELAKRFGRESGVFQSRALARFPGQSPDSIFPLAALEGSREDVSYDPDDAPIFAGIDVAGGGRDKTTCTIRRGVQIIAFAEWDSSDPFDECVELLSMFRAGLARVWVDTTGLGIHFANALRRSRFPVGDVNFSESADIDPRFRIITTGPVTPGRIDEFANAKAQIYWNFREKLRTGRVRGLARVPDAYKQLTLLRYGVEPGTGRIRMEQKSSRMKTRLGGSPDHAESVILSYLDAPTGVAIAGQAGAQKRRALASTGAGARRALSGR